MVVAQSVEWSLLMTEILGSTPVISKFLYSTFVSVNCIEKTKKKKKRPGMAHFKKSFFGYSLPQKCSMRKLIL